jgi:hypothetical protein
MYQLHSPLNGKENLTLLNQEVDEIMMIFTDLRHHQNLGLLFRLWLQLQLLQPSLVAQPLSSAILEDRATPRELSRFLSILVNI